MQRPGLRLGLDRRGDPGQRRRWLPILVLLLIGALLCWLGVLVISGFVQGREEAAVEADREGAIKPPLRVKLQPHGEPIVTFDTATQKRIDLRTIVPTLTHYEDQVRAYGRVLDLANLTMLNTNYVAATSQLNTAKAHLAASQPAFERAQSLYARNIDSLAQEEIGRGDRSDRQGVGCGGGIAGAHAGGDGATGVGSSHRELSGCGHRPREPANRAR